MARDKAAESGGGIAMPELLLELFSEELPARMQAKAEKDLAHLVAAGLRNLGLAHGQIRTFVTPRRLTLVVNDIPKRQPNRSEERRGPRADAPNKAIEGFLRTNGLNRADCEERATEKGTFLFAVIESKGVETASILPGLISEVIAKFPWQKSMRWGSGSTRWVRPLQRLMCLFDSRELAVETCNGIPCGNITSGHRFLAPEPFAVANFTDYETKLRNAFVMLDRDERKTTILEVAEKMALDEGLELREDRGLLEEVAGLVEWPVVMMGRIDAEFMGVPEEVLITSMRAHQKYFSLLKADGSLAPRFVMVANTEGKDGGTAIVAGNERVLRARLSDAKFFWDQDCKTTLGSRVPALAQSVFHAKLGSMAHKVERVTALAGELASHIPDCGVEDAKRAAHLAKADLVSEMVYEFPELQGVMGWYYALNDGEEETVAKAIAEHYAPLGPGDDCPSRPVSVAVALADKIDTLVGFFAIGETPSGSRDPYALRRAALGIIRLILENQLRLSLLEVIMKTYGFYNETVAEFQRKQPADQRPEKVQEDLMRFLADRLKVYLRERGIHHDHAESVFALDGEDDLVRFIARVDALSRFLASEEGENLLAAYKRASNIVAIEEKRENVSLEGEVAADKLLQDEELALFDALLKSSSRAKDAIGEERYIDAMEAMASLRSYVDSFFDKVTVNADDADLRVNRLLLLSQFRSTLGQIADFSRIEG